MQKEKLAQYIEHTALKANTKFADIQKLCNEATEYQFAVAVVPPYNVAQAHLLLQNSPVRLASVTGFPFGYHTAEVKTAEAKFALDAGAQDIDMVVNIGAILDENWAVVENELYLLKHICDKHQAQSKLIFETAYLNEMQILKLCKLVASIGINYAKTSTGFAPEGATLEVVKLMRANLPESVKIKASGGIRTLTQAIDFIQAGADRLGTSSGISIIESLKD
ncbi:MAG: deoxyribose-phosphate aldolase [Chitinophagales bacterium]|nr:deoxyribose-phosphate aldolase [Bacteroidota bacterium]MCB9043304.1 deoxyribose-phosphate aldolase [Chitinophagales bacterium]